MTPVSVKPGILWCLDPAAQALGALWHAELERSAKRVCRLASDAASVESHLREYNELGFNSTLDELGIAHDGGMRVTLVLLASGLGPEAFSDWPAVVDTVQRIPERWLVRAVEPQVVLFTYEGEHGPGQPPYFEAVSDWTPWLISSRSDDGRTLSPEQVRDLVGRLLDVLFFTVRPDADEERLHAFFACSSSGGMVRLVGQPRMDLGSLVEKATTDCELELLSQQRSGRPDEDGIRLALVAALRGPQEAFLRGQLSASELLTLAFGRKGLGAWTPVQLLAEGCRALRMLADACSSRVEVPALGPQTHAEPAPTNSVGLLRRIWRWLRRLFGRPALQRGAQSTPPAVVSEEVRYVLNRLHRGHALLEGLATAAGELTPHLAIPADTVASWQSTLARLLREALDNFARCADSGLPTADDVRQKLRRELEGDLETQLLDVVEGWGWETGPVHEFGDRLRSGSLLHFSGLLRGGESPSCAAVVTSLQFRNGLRVGHDRITCMRVDFWAIQSPLILTASQPVRVGSVVL